MNEKLMTASSFYNPKPLFGLFNPYFSEIPDG